MKNHWILLVAACALVPAAAPGLHAQPARCPDGPAGDANGIIVARTLGVPLQDVASIVDPVLGWYGYSPATRSRDQEEREVWTAGPNFVYVEGLDFPKAAGGANPGLQAVVTAQFYGPDSTYLLVQVNPVCRTMRDGQRDDSAENWLTALNAAILADALQQRAHVLQPDGLHLSVPAEDGAVQRLRAPGSAAGFGIVLRYEHEDPGEGVLLRYARGTGRFVDLEVVPGVPRECDAACAAGFATAAVQKNRDRLARQAEAGYYTRAEVRADEPLPVPAGASWRSARHLVAEVEVRREAAELHQYAFVYPGYTVNVYATFPPSEEMTRAVRAFQDEVLPTLLPQP